MDHELGEVRGAWAGGAWAGGAWAARARAGAGAMRSPQRCNTRLCGAVCSVGVLNGSHRPHAAPAKTKKPGFKAWF